MNSGNVAESQLTKRSWNQLHGGWGKRSDQLLQDEDIGDVLKEVIKEKKKKKKKKNGRNEQQ